nr:hypothetical protein [Moraxella osloensis]
MSNPNEIASFPQEVIEEIGYYVYRLLDPRNGETFYVGKGKGNRVFDHAKIAKAQNAKAAKERLLAEELAEAKEDENPESASDFKIETILRSCIHKHIFLNN